MKFIQDLIQNLTTIQAFVILVCLAGIVYLMLLTLKEIRKPIK